MDTHQYCHHGIWVCCGKVLFVHQAGFAVTGYQCNGARLQAWLLFTHRHIAGKCRGHHSANFLLEVQADRKKDQPPTIPCRPRAFSVAGAIAFYHQPAPDWVPDRKYQQVLTAVTLAAMNWHGNGQKHFHQFVIAETPVSGYEKKLKSTISITFICTKIQL
jgi:hypothetical protein